MLILGERIRQARRKKSITLDTLARRTGLTTGYLSKIERNLNNPPIATISRIATALGVKLTDFFQEVAQPRRLSIVRPDERKSITKDGSLFGYYYQALAHEYQSGQHELAGCAWCRRHQSDVGFANQWQRVLPAGLSVSRQHHVNL